METPPNYTVAELRDALGIFGNGAVANSDWKEIRFAFRTEISNQGLREIDHQKYLSFYHQLTLGIARIMIEDLEIWRSIRGSIWKWESMAYWLVDRECKLDEKAGQFHGNDPLRDSPKEKARASDNKRKSCVDSLGEESDFADVTMTKKTVRIEMPMITRSSARKKKGREVHENNKPEPASTSIIRANGFTKTQKVGTSAEKSKNFDKNKAKHPTSTGSRSTTTTNEMDNAVTDNDMARYRENPHIDDLVRFYQTSFKPDTYTKYNDEPVEKSRIVERSAEEQLKFVYEVFNPDDYEYIPVPESSEEHVDVSVKKPRRRDNRIKKSYREKNKNRPSTIKRKIDVDEIKKLERLLEEKKLAFKDEYGVAYETAANESVVNESVSVFNKFVANGPVANESVASESVASESVVSEYVASEYVASESVARELSYETAVEELSL